MTSRSGPYKSDTLLPVDTQTELSPEEVAAIMTDRGYPMGRTAVYNIEKRALRKLRDGLLEIGFVYDQ